MGDRRERTMEEIKNLRVLESNGGEECLYQLTEWTLNRKSIQFAIDQLTGRSWQLRQANVDFAVFINDDECNLVKGHDKRCPNV